MVKEYTLDNKLPFEDGIFIAFYRSILLRNVEFCDINSAKDLAKCTQLTNKFIKNALSAALAIINGKIDVHDVLKNIDSEYDQEKAFNFLYIVYRELFRRNNPISFTVLTKLRLYEFKEPQKSVFYDFDCKMAWDYLLSYFAQERFTKNLFTIMWFRYRKIIIKCKANEYEDFVYNLYLKDVKNKTNFTRSRPEKDEYTAILQRAEGNKTYKNIFDEVP